jgi:hypothetical protein
VVENHLDQFGMKKYFHEDSPLDDIFKGVKLYDEVPSRIQNLIDKEKSKFLNFKKTQEKLSTKDFTSEEKYYS